jgi:Caspase domain
MNRSVPFFSSFFSLLLAVALAPPPAAAAEGPATGLRLRRFALMIGVNDGGAARARLRYATSDARSMARVLENLGGVSTADLVFVDTPSRAATLDGFSRVEALMRSAATPGVRRELLVYYSGHSDEEGLLLGEDRIGYGELRARLAQVPAELRVAILDSCASGAFTRGKGGVRRPPFLVDASADMRGHAFLTSSAATEVAQESDRIAASFFTYYLVSGLRGAADVNQDHRVTLQEAYQFASQETLARTERTKGGPQHAAYEFELSGTGDMVVTDVRTTQASLVLAPELAGRITVREAGGALVAELRKPAGKAIELGVEAGSYVVAMDGGTGGPAFEATTTLVAGDRRELARLAFHPGKPLELAMARGDAPDAVTGSPDGALTLESEPAHDTAADTAHDTTSARLGIVPRAGDAHTDIRGFSFGFVGDRARRVLGFQLGLGWTEAQEQLRGLQLTVGGTIVKGDARGLQLAAGVTYAEGTFHGMQLAGLATLTRGEAHGLQLAGAASLADGWMTGAQVAGAVSAAHHSRGLQLAGGVAAADDFEGMQLAVVNAARVGTGIQLGVVNAIGDGGGFRLGVVNAGRHTKGFQLGLINVAEHDDGESFALLSLIGNGIHDVAVYATDAMLTNLAVELGGRHLYTTLGAGYQPGDARAAGSQTFSRGSGRWAPGVGLGWRTFVGAGRLEHVDLEAHEMQVFPTWSVNGNGPMLNSLRLQAAIHLAPHVALRVGVSANVVVGQEGADLDLSLGGPQDVIHSGRTTVRIYPGFVAGLEI